MQVKIFLLFLFYMLSFCQGNAQNIIEESKATRITGTEEYHSFLNNAGWLTRRFYWEDYENYWVHFTKDTIMNGYHYHLLEQEHAYIEGVGGYDSCYIVSAYKSLFIREDTSEKRVYQYDGIDPETLMYDFNVSLADTFYFPDEEIAIVSAIDSVQTLDGNQRKRITLQYIENADSVVWIEGIGNMKDPFYNYFPYVYDSETIYCHYECGSLVYDTSGFIFDPSVWSDAMEIFPDFTECSSAPVIYEYIPAAEEQFFDNIQLYPLPADHCITLDLSEAKAEYSGYEIFTMSGEKTGAGRITNNTSTITISEKGMYVLLLIREDGFLICRKIMIQ